MCVPAWASASGVEHQRDQSKTPTRRGYLCCGLRNLGRSSALFLGSANTEWTADITVFPAETRKRQALALGADVAVGGGIIGGLIFEAGTRYARVLALGHPERVSQLYNGHQVGCGLTAATGYLGRSGLGRYPRRLGLVPVRLVRGRGRATAGGGAKGAG